MHPADVWLTRLEAALPHAELATDLVLQAEATQQPVSNVFTLSKFTGDPCPAGQTSAPGTIDVLRTPPRAPRDHARRRGRHPSRGGAAAWLSMVR